MAIDRAQLGSWRQWALLTGLVIVLGVVLIVRRGGAPAPAATPRRASNAQGGTATQVRPSAGDLDVRLEALEAERASPEEIARNPFRFEARRAREREAPEAPPSRAPSEQREAPGPAGPPLPPPIPLKFIGVIESPGVGRVAALSDGRHVFQGRTGDIIEGRYRIVRIGTESIVLEPADGGPQQTIRLTGQ